MAHKFLPNQAVDKLWSNLARIGTVHGPSINDRGVYGFTPASSLDDLQLDYQRTQIPPKKYLLPPQTTTLNFSPEEGYSFNTPDITRQVLFGLHACDLASIGYLDSVFADDPLYMERRKKLFLVGISCEPDEFCFCGDVGINPWTVPFDIFLTEAEGGFFIRAGSEAGEEIVRGIEGIAEKKAPARTVVQDRTSRRIEKEVAAGKQYETSPLWDDFARRCLSCGACSLCCPTCYCVDVREYGNLDGRTATRVQEWDNCLFRAHGEVAGGFSFRRTRQERFRYRFLHKYYGFGPLKGTISCVGCGRCREVCPVRIDLLEFFQEE